MEVVTGAMLDFDDLQATPDDGRRWEILDGAFVVNAPPGRAHQLVVRNLVLALHGPAAAAGLEVYPAPFAWRIGPGQIPEPDLIVVDPSVVTDRAVEGPPAIVVEVLSPWGRARDLIEKRRIYADGGAGEYWVVDPDRDRPSVTVLRLQHGVYEEVATVTGDDAHRCERPLAVRIVPAELLRR